LHYATGINIVDDLLAKKRELKNIAFEGNLELAAVLLNCGANINDRDVVEFSKSKSIEIIGTYKYYFVI